MFRLSKKSSICWKIGTAFCCVKSNQKRENVLVQKKKLKIFEKLVLYPLCWKKSFQKGKCFRQAKKGSKSVEKLTSPFVAKRVFRRENVSVKQKSSKSVENLASPGTLIKKTAVWKTTEKNSALQMFFKRKEYLEVWR